MDKLEVAEIVLDRQYKKICEALKNEKEGCWGGDADNRVENEPRIILELIKQELQECAEGEKWSVQVIRPEAWQGNIFGLKISLQKTFDAAKTQFQQLLKENAQLRERFLGLAKITIPKCSNGKSLYMKRNYPRITQDLIWKENRRIAQMGLEKDGKVSPVEEPDAGWEGFLEQIQTIASLESLLDLKEQLDDVLQEAKEKSRPKQKLKPKPDPKPTEPGGEELACSKPAAACDAPKQEGADEKPTGADGGDKGSDTAP